MFHRFKMYIIFAAIAAIALVLILNKFLVYGLIVLGVGAIGVAEWQLFMKQKDDEIYNLRKQLEETSQNSESLKSENVELRNRKLNISEIKTVGDLGLMEVNTNVSPIRYLQRPPFVVITIA